MKETLYYQTTVRYRNLGKFLVKDVLENFDYKDASLYFIEYENDEVVPISTSCSYLENMNKNRKIWLLEYDRELGSFIN